MLRLPSFTYRGARTVGEAHQYLCDGGPDAMVVAGGTDLYPNMKRRQFEPKVLVGLRGIRELVGVRGSAEQGFVVGALTTLGRLAEDPTLGAAFPALTTAAGLVSSPQLRNMGTIGGNICVDTRCNYYNQTYQWRQAAGFCMKKDGDVCLVAPGSRRCWAVSSSDTAPVLWSLGARVRLSGPAGERVIPVSALYRDDGIAYLAKRPDEILTEVMLAPVAGTRSVYLKLRRRGSFDFPVLGVAVALRIDGGVVQEGRIVLGAVGSEPREATTAAGLLAGQRLTPELIAAVAAAASRPSKPLDNTDMTHPYRKKMTRVFVERALRQLAGLPAGAAA
jgi:4-hydroxybenzoyl-CoA reductase subunit beta